MEASENIEPTVLPICRLCLHEGKPHNLRNTVNMTVVINIFELALDYKIPRSICETCFEELKRTSLFIKKCQNAHSVLTQIMKDHQYVEGCKPDSDSEDNEEIPEGLIKSAIEVLQSNITLKESPIPSEEVTTIRSESKQCPKCGETIVTTLTQHYRTKRKCRPRNMQCSECGVTCERPSDLKRHMCTHTSNSPFMCHICSKMFKYVTSLNRHIREHSKKEKENINLTCDVCKKTFLHKGLFNAHRIRYCGKKQDDKRTSKCRFCKKEFQNFRMLLAHIDTIHRSDKRYSCQLCYKRFTLKSTLRAHLMAHAGEQPFACNLCPKKYTHKSSLAIHLMHHQKQKAFACDLCNKRFYIKSSLKIHRRIHTGEKPYVCHLCNKGFYDSSSRKKHVGTVHGEEEVHFIKLNEIKET